MDKHVGEKYSTSMNREVPFPESHICEASVEDPKIVCLSTLAERLSNQAPHGPAWQHHGNSNDHDAGDAQLTVRSDG